jgi:hypothetical protein
MMWHRRRWPAEVIVRPALDRLPVCELDCRAVECRHSAWTRGEDRLRYDDIVLMAWLPRLRSVKAVRATHRAAEGYR